jgi:hypothetical protein
MQRLLGHLAQFNAFSRQGEVLCTQALAFLLREPDARVAFASHLSTLGMGTVSADLGWRAEAKQTDGGRPDLEGLLGGVPQVKVEAKLSAPLSDGQFRSYLQDLTSRCDSGKLVVLVPSYRISEIAALLRERYALDGQGPWRWHSDANCWIAVTTWEAVIGALRSNCPDGLSGESAQFEAMYHALTGDLIVGPTSDEELLAWRDKEVAFVTLVDRVTRCLAVGEKSLPFGKEQTPHYYHRRYVCLELGDKTSCFSIGVRDPFDAFSTPVWLRFNSATPHYSLIRSRLGDSELAWKLVESGGHVWLPLEVVPSQSHLVEALTAQAKAVIEVAYKPVL